MADNLKMFGLPVPNECKNFKSSEHINEKGGGPYRGFDYLSLVSDPLDLTTRSQGELLRFCNFQRRTRYKD